MSWGNYEFKCPECMGAGEVVCGQCDCEHECDSCDGEGVDTERVDLPAFKAACVKAFENEIWVGREADNGAKVYYRDFLRLEA